MKKTTILAMALGIAPLSSQAAWITFANATGWNHDVVYGVGETTSAGITGSIDEGPTGTGGASLMALGQAGSDAGSGLPGAATLSATGSGASFQTQGFINTSNAVFLAPGSSGALTLASPTSLTTLALYGLCGNGNITGSITINYANATTQTFDIGAIGQDWFGGSSIALTLVDRQYDDGGLENDGNNPRVYEQLYTTNTTSPVVSVTINDATRVGGGTGGFLAVLAISGNTVPEPSAALLTAALGLIGFARRRRP